MRPGWLSLAWHRHRNLHGAPTVALHHLRHWNASTLIATGVPLPTVQARLGHAAITTTGIYAHSVGDDDMMAAGRLSAVLAGTQKRPPPANRKRALKRAPEGGGNPGAI